MEHFVEAQAHFRGGPWAGKFAPVRFEKVKPKVAVVVIDEQAEAAPKDITARPPFTRHVYELAEEFHPTIDTLTAENEVVFVYQGPMEAGQGRLN